MHQCTVLSEKQIQILYFCVNIVKRYVIVLPEEKKNDISNHNNIVINVSIDRDCPQVQKF